MSNAETGTREAQIVIDVVLKMHEIADTLIN
jgi:hypothetical protein